MQPPEAAGFLQLKQPKICSKNMKNAKNNNANLYSKFSPRFFKSYFLTGGGHGPPLESPMSRDADLFDSCLFVFVLFFSVISIFFIFH